MAIQYIREHIEKLAKRKGFGKYTNRGITAEKIWSRLSLAGFDSFKIDENLVKNMASARPRTMQEGVRNLINAVYIACMI